MPVIWSALLAWTVTQGAPPARPPSDEGDAIETVTPTSAEPTVGHVTGPVNGRPAVRGGIYDKPYIRGILGDIAIGGYAELNWGYETADGLLDETGFELRRLNFFVFAPVHERVNVSTELEIEEAGEEITVEYGIIDLAVDPAFTLRAGIILTPLGRFNLAHDAPLNDQVARPLVSTALLGVALSQPGAGAAGVIELGGVASLSYEVYAVNGFNEGVVNGGERGVDVVAGKRGFEDNNSSPAVTGRVAGGLWPTFEVGLSGQWGVYNRYAVEGTAIDEKRTLTLGAADFELLLDWFEARGEAALVKVELPPALEEFLAAAQRGAYLETAAHFLRGAFAALPESHFTLTLRLDAVDFDAGRDGDSHLGLTAGLNFRIIEETVVKLDYSRGFTRDRFDTATPFAAVRASLATYF